MKKFITLLSFITYSFAQTSATDTSEFRSICLAAATDDTVFRTFKTQPDYTRVLEHVNKSQGTRYLNYLQSHYPQILSLHNKCKANDLLGNPITFSYPEVGEISPTTLRYMKVAGDIEKHFKDLSTHEIIEIGGGYGGQCLVLSNTNPCKKYILIDLPEPLALQKKYLSKHAVTRTEFIPYYAVTEKKGHLVISNYAFSECSREVQKEYFEKLIKYSIGGYITWNDYTGHKVDEITATLKEYGFKPEVLSEEPLTAPNNCIIIWKN